MTNIYRGPEDAIEIPPLSVTSYVLEEQGARADKPALIDGPSGRTVTYGELEQRDPLARGRPRGSAASARATCSASTCRTSPSTRSPSTAPPRPAAARRR